MKKNNIMLVRLTLIVGVMVLLTFAAVPFYQMFCQATGYGGTTQRAEKLPGIVLEREITVRFNTDVHRDLAWKFWPEKKQMTVKLGQGGLTNFVAVNNTPQAMTGTAIYNVSPLKAGKYFHKIQCFCFDKQSLEPHQQANFPVYFYVDPAMAEDPNLKDVQVITLSYTFFKAHSKELDLATQKFQEELENSVLD